jgi:hypothetical protein
MSRRRMIWLLPHPFPLFPSASCLSFSVFLCIAGQRLPTGEDGEGVEDEPNSYDGEKTWSFVNHSILSDFTSLCVFFNLHVSECYKVTKEHNDNIK